MTELQLVNLKHKLQDIWYYPQDIYHRLSERFGRSIAFAKFGYMHYDFESAYLYSLMSFKLKRIKNSLVNGSAIQEPEHMAALDELIVICDRLFNEIHEDKYLEEHEIKWGELDLTTKSGFVVTSRPNAVTDEQKEEQRKDLLAIYEKAQVDRDADIDRLAVILKKHQQTWWD